MTPKMRHNTNPWKSEVQIFFSERLPYNSTYKQLEKVNFDPKLLISRGAYKWNIGKYLKVPEFDWTAKFGLGR